MAQCKPEGPLWDDGPSLLRQQHYSPSLKDVMLRPYTRTHSDLLPA